MEQLVVILVAIIVITVVLLVYGAIVYNLAIPIFRTWYSGDKLYRVSKIYAVAAMALLYFAKLIGLLLSLIGLFILYLISLNHKNETFEIEGTEDDSNSSGRTEISAPDELRKWKQLLDEGAITQEERMYNISLHFFHNWQKIYSYGKNVDIQPINML